MTKTRVCVVGSGWAFTSGVSYFTCRLANAFAASGHDVSAVLMRRLIPAFLYPGRQRVGQRLNNLDYDPRVRVFNGVDWHSPLSLLRACLFIWRCDPEVVILQWWTGAVLHNYVALVLVARARRATVIVEFHEVQDTGEMRLPLAARYHRLLAGLVLRRTHAFVVHSEFDRVAVAASLPVDGRPIRVVPHGPFDHHIPAQTPPRLDDDDAIHLLFFGTIRPYKGLENLVEAFDALAPDEVARLRLSIVGETWENWTAPLRAAERSRYRDRITIVNRYVHDDEVASWFAAADAVVLPYLRSSASGPLHIAMSAGLPVVVTDTGGLRAAAGDYPGAVWVPPGDVEALRRALLHVTGLVGRRYRDPRSWNDSVEAHVGVAQEVAALCG